MQTKPSWTTTNEKGDKYFWYDNIGWIDSRTGCVAENIQPVPSAAPSDATHVQIHKGAVHYVRKTATDYCLQNEWGEWVCCGGDVNGISGTVVRLSDGYLAKRDCGSPVTPETSRDAEGWHAYGSTSDCPMHKDRVVEIELRDGRRATARVNNCLLDICGRGSDIARWRYVS